MLKSLSRILAGAVLAAGLAVAPVYAQDTIAKIKERGTIVVGVKNDYKPWGYLDPSGKIVGMEIDLVNDIASKLGVKVEMIPVIAANRMEFLNQGRIDLILATMGDTADRRKVIGMIEPNYYAGGTNVLAPKSANLKQWTDLKGRKVCGVQGAYYNRRVTQLYAPELVVFPAVPEALNALAAGNCVAFLFDNTLIESTLAGGDPKWAGYEMPLPTEDPQLWAMGIRQADMNAPFGEFLKKLSVDWHKSGKLLELEKKWGIKENPFLKEMNQKAKSS